MAKIKPKSRNELAANLKVNELMGHIRGRHDLAKDLRISQILGNIDKLNARYEELRDSALTCISIVETEVQLATGEAAVLYEIKDRPDVLGVLVTKEHLDSGAIKPIQAYEQLAINMLEVEDGQG